MKILITGIAGFIGSNLGEYLLRNNHKIIGIDNFDLFYNKETKEKNISTLIKSSDFEFYEADIRNKSQINSILSSERPEIVVHLAAKAGVRPSIQNPGEYYDVNVMGTLNILECMQANSIFKMILASSSSIYGNNKKVPFCETDNVDNPISPYAASKKSCELLCHTYCHLYGFNINCLRLFTVYGPRQRPDLAIFKFTKVLFDNEPIPIYGDGTSSRDYTHVTDIVQGIVNSLDNLNGYNIFNLGESKTISLMELVNLLQKYTGKQAILKYLPKQAGDVERTYADITKAKMELSYRPQVSIEDGVKDFVSWYKNQY
jgi:UDP-glucuronate 4-epimerase